MDGLQRLTESEERALASPIDMTELLGRLNDREEQQMAYPAIDDYEDRIDLVATDILHGWRDSETYTEQALFADAFANAFRVLVVAEGQQVLRRTGCEEDRWVWEYTGHIAGWTVVGYAGDAVLEQAEDEGGTAASYYGAGRQRWFATAAEAAGRALEIASVAGEHCQRARVVVRGIEVCSGRELGEVVDGGPSGERVGAVRGES